jgi:hypothetical protein
VNCDQAYRQLGEYLEGSLPGPIGDELVLHLQQCTPCADVRRDLEDPSRLSRECPEPPLPEELRQRLQAFLRDK